MRDTFPVPWPRRSASWRPGAHPCKRAFDALTEAGHSPDVVKVYGFASLLYGFASLPDVTSGRREVKRLTGESFVPVLVLDDGEVIKDSQKIVDWGASASRPRGRAMSLRHTEIAPGVHRLRGTRTGTCSKAVAG